MRNHTNFLRYALFRCLNEVFPSNLFVVCTNPDLFIMISPLRLLVVVQAVSLRRKRDNSTAGLVHINHHLADVMQDPEEKSTRFDQSHDCHHYQDFTPRLIDIPCYIMQKVIELTKAELEKQAAHAAFDVVTFGVLTFINGFAEAGSLLAQATAPDVSIPAVMTVGALLENDIQKAYSFAQKELMRDCCFCQGGAEMTVQDCLNTPCYKRAVAVYEKVTKKHALVDTVVNTSNKIALTAAVTGISIDILSGGTSMGAGTIVAGQTGVAASVVKNVFQVGHVGYSCVQQGWLENCWEDMCRGEPAG